MKRNFAMTIAACLLVVTMLSLCMVSSTYAKYTTSGSDNDSARVAKWGVDVTVALADLFDAEYDTTGGTVKAAGTYDMLAPGTTDSVAAFIKIEGIPEVSTEVIANATVTLANWEDESSAYYCPLVVTVGSVSLNGLDYSSTTEFADAIKTQIETQINGTYDPNDTDLEKSIGISWSWAIENGADDIEKAAYNKKDTYLGDQAAAGTPATFAISLEVTVNQVD